MDTLTHMVTGACIGQLIMGRHGKKAMVWGAIIQNLPDLDFITLLWVHPPSSLLVHRGISHSFALALLTAILISVYLSRGKLRISFSRWFLFVSVQLAVHILLDSCNSYGTGLWEPFSHTRVSFNILFVADPFFSLWPAIACLVLVMLKPTARSRNTWSYASITVCIFYLVFAIEHKRSVNNTVSAWLQGHHMAGHTFITTPAPFQQWLWYIVVRDQGGYYIGYRSVFDKKSQPVLTYHPVQDSLLAEIKDHREVELLKRFAQGFYTVEKNRGRLVFNDLRFGQVSGWESGEHDFVFHYYLEQAGENSMVLQRGRFAGINKSYFSSLFRRVCGD